MAPRAIAAVIMLAIAAQSAAAACQSSPESICQEKGAGLHCDPCRAEKYVVCSDEGSYTVQICPEGEHRLFE